MLKNRTGNFLEFFGSVGSVFRSVRSILGPRVVVDRFDHTYLSFYIFFQFLRPQPPAGRVGGLRRRLRAPGRAGRRRRRPQKLKF